MTSQATLRPDGSHRKGIVRTVLAFVFLLVASGESGALCGDCNGDGRVAADELVQTVHNVFAAGEPTATPLPDRCSSSQPGQRIHAAGSDWIVVEAPVTLDDSSMQFALRYPVRLDQDGDLSGVSPRHLQRTCFPPDFSCPYFLGALTSICGYRAATKADASLRSSNYSESTLGSTKKYVWSNFVFVRAEATIVVDPNYDPIRITLDFTQNTTADVSDISRFGYSLIRASYPPPAVDEAAIRSDLEQLLGYISIRPR